MAATRLGLYGGPRFSTSSGVSIATAVLSGTLDGSLESDIEGKTLIWTLTNDTFVAAGTGPIGSTANSQALIDSITGSSTWNTARAQILVTDLVRTSDTVATLTLSAAVQALYDISADDSLTSTIPGEVLTGAAEIVSSGAISITAIVEDDEQPTGGFAAQNWYDAYRQKRQKRKKKRKKVLEEIKKLDGVEAEIAKLLHKDLEREARDKEIKAIEDMVVSTYTKGQVEAARIYSENLAKAYVRAAEQRNFSALKAFEREMELIKQEEEAFLLIAMVALR